MKRCSKCGVEKPLCDFPKNKHKRNKDGLHYYCSECKNMLVRNYRKNNPEKVAAQKLKYYKKFYQRNLEYSRNYSKTHPEKIAMTQKIWREANPDKIKNYKKIGRERLMRSPEKRLNLNMAIAICEALKRQKGRRHWETLVGYNAIQLKKHLEKQFVMGMTWDNYGEWHVDHIIPKSLFNFKTAEDIDFKRCWSLENLQPLWKIENLKKNKRFDMPFQPSFALSITGESKNEKI